MFDNNLNKGVKPNNLTFSIDKNNKLERNRFNLELHNHNLERNSNNKNNKNNKNNLHTTQILDTNVISNKNKNTKGLRKNVSRQRLDTEVELQIVNQQFHNVVHVGRPKFIITNIHFMLYKLLYHKYLWNIFMFSIYFLSRFFLGKNISLYEWYNDSLFFVLSNNYLYKRLHWNNDFEKYFTYQSVKCYFYFIATYIFMFLFEHISVFSQFHFSKNSVEKYNIYEYICFSIICIYIILLQLFSIIFLLNSKTKNITRKHFLKYIALLMYIFLEYICYGLYYIFHIEYNESVFFISNNYRIHHWMLGLFLLIFTELPQQYHTNIQYIHYAVYLHGLSSYGYDSILE
jgi:hypothetical protein